MKNITFLGPVGATFSHDAYNVLAEIYGAPKVTQTNYITATSNSEILKLIRGYGVLPMETLLEGRINESLKSFIELLKLYTKNADYPFHIVGAVQMKLHFCLMVRPDMSTSSITKVIAHPKSLAVCKGKIAKMAVPIVNVLSNGEAARLVAEDEEYATFAALGPRSASEKYGLKVLDAAFEDKEAITTFVLVAPTQHKVSVGKENRVIIVFKIPHIPGALVKSLQPFAQEGLNLLQIHSVYAGNNTYDFAIEFGIHKNKLKIFDIAMESFKKHVDTYISFGPFEVLSK